MNSFKIVASSTESTVVAEYTPEKRKSTDYQSETALEQDFINRLVSQGYEYITIKSEQDLIDNLRTQLEKLNNYTFFDKEWNDFYQSIYIDLYQDYAKKSDIEKERINDDIVFEIELIKQVEVNIDYILMLVAKYHESNCEDKTILANINKSIDASVELRSKKALIEGFVAQMTVKTDVEKDWKDFVKKQKEQDLEAIIKDEKLKHDEAQKFMENSFRDGGIKTTGTDLDKILPPISRFSGGSNRALKKQTVIDKLKDFFEKYFGLV